MMNYSFDVSDANKYGVEEAIILKNLTFWIAKNKADGRNYYDGKWWTYNSAKSFAELFPFWNAEKIKRILQSLVSQKAIIKGNYNKTSYDRTAWYALNDEKEISEINKNNEISPFWLMEMDIAQDNNQHSKSQNSLLENQKINNQKAEIDSPIPDIKPDIKPDINSNKREEDSLEITKKQKFVKPTIDQVQDYLVILKNTGKDVDINQDSENFYDYFESNGWKVGGKTQMQDWQASLRSWINRKKMFQKTNFNQNKAIMPDGTVNLNQLPFEERIKIANEMQEKRRIV